MYYCENCLLLNEEPVCDYCGGTHLRAPRDDDYCYLATRFSPWDEALCELLRDSGIEAVMRPSGGLQSFKQFYFGQTQRQQDIFVPYTALETARGLSRALDESGEAAE